MFREFHDPQALALIIQRLLFHEDFPLGEQLKWEIESHGWEARDVADGYQLVPRR